MSKFADVWSLVTKHSDVRDVSNVNTTSKEIHNMQMFEDKMPWFRFLHTFVNDNPFNQKMYKCDDGTEIRNKELIDSCIMQVIKNKEISLIDYEKYYSKVKINNMYLWANVYIIPVEEEELKKENSSALVWYNENEG